jgi:hypothetical protein
MSTSKTQTALTLLEKVRVLPRTGGIILCKTLWENEEQIQKRCEDFGGKNESIVEAICIGYSSTYRSAIGGLESEHCATILRWIAVANFGTGSG